LPIYKKGITDNNSRSTYNNLLTEITQYDQSKKKCEDLHDQTRNCLLSVNLKSELKTNAAGENQISQLSLLIPTSWSKRLKIPSKSAN